jgi:glycosyltransferase involved in cell wall biosynthesis
MRLLMTTDAIGGVWTYTTELRAQLASCGIEVVLATLGPQPPPDPASPYVPCRLEWQPDPWEDVASSGRRLLELAEEADAELVHLNGFAHGALAWEVPVVVVAHSCVLSWHEAVRGVPAGSDWARYQATVMAGLRGADAVVAPTAAMRAALRRHYDYDRRCRLIANGVSPHPGPSGPRAQLVLAAGRLWDQAKGLDALDRAAAQIAWPVAIGGDAGGRTAGHAQLLGVLPRDELRARMGQAAIFAHPASYEPFGLVVVEAALAGCALVLGDIPALRELWDGDALFVAPGDAATLADACERLIGDEDLRRVLAARARRRAASYDAATMAAGYVQLYERLLASERGSVHATVEGGSAR